VGFTVCVTVFCKDHGKHQQSLKYLMNVIDFDSLGQDITHLQACHVWVRRTFNSMQSSEMNS